MPAAGDPAQDGTEVLLHATTVAVDGRGLLILGPSGSGKSALALVLIGLGAALVADDQTSIRRQGNDLVATCPPRLHGLIEARGIGLLHAPPAPPTVLAYAVDLGRVEAERLPPFRQFPVIGVPLDLVLGRSEAHFPFMLMQLLRTGRAMGPDLRASTNP